MLADDGRVQAYLSRDHPDYARPEVVRCIITPIETNRHAIRAYEKIGFHHWRTQVIPGEPGPVYLMRITREAIA